MDAQVVEMCFLRPAVCKPKRMPDRSGGFAAAVPDPPPTPRRSAGAAGAPEPEPEPERGSAGPRETATKPLKGAHSPRGTSFCTWWCRKFQHALKHHC